MLVKLLRSFPIPALAQIPLGKGLFAIVDPTDLPWLMKFRWFSRKSNSRVYALRKFIIDGKEYTIRMHRQLTGCPKDMEVHHINGDTLDNRMENLQIIEPKLHAALRILR